MGETTYSFEGVSSCSGSSTPILGEWEEVTISRSALTGCSFRSCRVDEAIMLSMLLDGKK